MYICLYLFSMETFKMQKKAQKVIKELTLPTPGILEICIKIKK